MKNWYVITGGPCSGKTTTINLLKTKGYKITEETARIHYEREAKKGLAFEQIRGDQQKWQDSIAKLQVELELSLDQNETIFLDRALPDSMAYYQFLRLPVPQFFADLYIKRSYGKVFILDRLPMVLDGVRNETDKEAEEISNAIKRSYERLGMDLVSVPVLPREERIEFILKHI